MSSLTFEEIRTRMSSAHSVGVAGRVERIFSRDILGGKIVYYLGGFYIFGEVSNYCHFVFPPLVYTTIILLPLWKSNDFSYVRRTKKICPIKWTKNPGEIVRLNGLKKTYEKIHTKEKALARPGSDKAWTYVHACIALAVSITLPRYSCKKSLTSVAVSKSNFTQGISSFLSSMVTVYCVK